MSGHRGFSLKEEAQQTSRRSRTHCNPESKLRGNPVAFTSSGAKNPLQDGEQADSTSQATGTGAVGPQSPQPLGAVPVPNAPTWQSLASTDRSTSSETQEVVHHDISRIPCGDGRAEPPSVSHKNEPKEHPASPTSSCFSDEEIILFTGRGGAREKLDLSPLPANEEMTLEVETHIRMSSSGLPPIDPEDTLLSSAEGIRDESDEGDQDVSDYLANLLANGEELITTRFHFRDLGASDDEVCLSHDSGISGPGSFDSDTDYGPAISWKTGRKKSDSKHPHTASRRKGLKKAKPQDLFSRYPSGMSMDQVIEELQKFLLSSEEQLSFPPLSKPFRKMLHEMAGRVRLKSKSIGKSDTRRPVLYRTKATPIFDPGHFEAVTSKISRRFGGPKFKAGMKRSRPGAGGAASTGYRDGEVAGSGLPELGAENRGRAMMEKMGWSTGMALGTTSNKGILQPVSQVVKRTKAGLGQE